MADSARRRAIVEELLKRRRAEAEATPAPTPEPLSVGDAFARGIAIRQTQMTQPGSWFGPGERIAPGIQERPDMVPPVIPGGMDPNAPLDRSAFDTWQDVALRREEPEGFLPGLAQRVGQTVAEPSTPLSVAVPLRAAAGIAAPGLATGRLPLALEGASLAAAPIAEQTAEEAGAGPLGQMAAGIAAGMAAPSAISRTARIVTRGPETTRPIRQLSAYGLSDTDSQEAARIAAVIEQRYGRELTGGAGADAQDIVDAAILHKAEYPRGRSTDPAEFVREARGELARTRTLFPDPEARPATPGAVGPDLSGHNITSAALREAGRHSEVAAEQVGRGLRARRFAEAMAQRELPNFRPYEQTRRTAETTLNRLAENASREWGRVGDLSPRVPAHRFYSALDQLAMQDANALANLPRQLRRYLEPAIREQFGDTIPVSELQAISSQLGIITRLAGNRVAPVEAAVFGEGAAKYMRRVVESMIDDAGEVADIPALRGARAATKMEKDFERLSRDILRFSDPKSVVQKIRAADDTEETLRLLLEAERGQLIDLDGIRGYLLEQVTGGDFGARTPRQMRNTLARNDTLFEMLMSQEQLETIVRNVDRWERAVTNARQGTTGQTYGTGTGYRSVAEELAEAFDQSTPWQRVRRKLQEQAINRTIGGFQPSRQANRIADIAALDPDMADLLLQTPTPQLPSGVAAVTRAAFRPLEKSDPAIVSRLAREGILQAATPEDIERIRRQGME